MLIIKALAGAGGGGILVRVVNAEGVEETFNRFVRVKATYSTC